jgi:hypothetical protein
MAVAPVKAVNLAPVLVVMAKDKCVFNKAFLPYNKPVRLVVVLVKSLPIPAVLVMAKDECVMKRNYK